MDMSILTRRIGPLPGWAWGGLIAVGAWWFFLRGKGATTTGQSGSSGATATPGPNATYGLGFAQGQQAAQALQAPAATPAQQTATVHGTQGGTGLFTGPSMSSTHLIDMPDGTPVTLVGQPIQGQVVNAPPHGSSPLWVQVKTASGQSGYAWLPDLVLNAVGGAIGAIGGPARKHAVGSRAAAPVWHDAHPLIGAPVKYAHYVRAVGGPGNHRREVHRVAHQAGVHPARVEMLNPHYTGRIRIA